MGEDGAQKEAMLWQSSPFERLLERGDLAPQLAARQVGDSRDILLPSEQRLQHLPSTHAEHIAADSGQLDIGTFQHLLQAIGLLHALADECLAITGELPQGTYGGRRDEAGLQQAVAQQVGQPFAVLDIRLAPGHRLHVLGVDQEDPAPLLQQIVDRPPIHARAFERHVRYSLLLQPLRQRQQVRRHGPKRARLLLRMAFHTCQHHRHDDGPLMHVDPCTAFVHHAHRLTPFRQPAYSKRSARRVGCETTTSFLGVLTATSLWPGSATTATVSNPGHTQGTFFDGLTRTSLWTPLTHDSREAVYAIFMRCDVARGDLGRSSRPRQSSGCWDWEWPQRISTTIAWDARWTGSTPTIRRRCSRAPGCGRGR